MGARVFSIPLPHDFPAPTLAAALADSGEILRAALIDAGAEHSDTGAMNAGWYLVLDGDSVSVLNDLPQADWIDSGRAGFHLPSRMTRWKYGKNGPYGHVAFRIYTPTRKGGGSSSGRRRLGSTMPSRVHRMARKLETRERLAGFGNTYKQSKSYDYYRGAFGELPSQLDGVKGYQWKASQVEGMFQAGSPNTPGERNSKPVHDGEDHHSG